MKQKEVLQKISKEIRDLHQIDISKSFYYYGGEGDTFIGIPLSLIQSIEETEVVSTAESQIRSADTLEGQAICTFNIIQ